ncbi:MAG: exodeoxyribonuclease III [Mariprofundaceae bacterium]
MRIVTWNVNSLNVRLPHLLDYLDQHQPDIIALQETKLPDERFPKKEIEAAGYYLRYSGQKAYNGVAILSRTEIVDVETDLPGLDDPQRRLMAATIDGMRIINVYIPNGQEVGSEKYAYKIRWLHALRDYLQSQIQTFERVIVLGDFNIAPADVDIHNPKRWQGKILCSQPERDLLQSLLDLGFRDSVRQIHQDNMFSWWDYRLSAFKRGWGLRIDLLLLTEALHVNDAGVDIDVRALERPSDHAPVWIDI